jgi:hypothetical protein
MRASEQGVSLVEGGSNESGEALNIRVGVKTASLAGVAKTNAMGFKNLLQWSAQWTGANPDEVEVIPNTDFSDKKGSIEEMNKWIVNLEKGSVTLEDFHAWLVIQELTSFTDFNDWNEKRQESSLSIPDFVTENM